MINLVCGFKKPDERGRNCYFLAKLMSQVTKMGLNIEAKMFAYKYHNEQFFGIEIEKNIFLLFTLNTTLNDKLFWVEERKSD